jgi:aminopeptidase N
VPQSYRDAWISEGFAEFAGWWYTESILDDSAAVRKIMKKSKDALMLRRRQAGPLWLGTRLAEGDMPQDYSLIVYQKGAWVVRMLRYLMFDPDSAGEQPFRRMIKDFYEQYRGSQASTQDFQDVVARHFGTQMDWFFNSWVYGTGIPTYEWSQTTVQEGGKNRWKLHVNQKDVPDDFTMIVPVHLFFPTGQDGWTRALVKGPSTDFTVEVPAKPSRVVFNENDAVLADVKEGRWR